MAFDYSEFVQLARDLTTEFGRAVTLKKDSVADEDNTKPWRAPDEAASNSTSALEIETLGAEVEGDERTFGDMLPRGKKGFVLPYPTGVLAFDPEEATILLDGTRPWKIVKVNAIKPGPTVCAYIVEVDQ